MSLKPIRLVPDNTRIPFVKIHKIGMAFTLIVTIIALGALFTRGLNFGVDFTGGMIVELRLEQDANLPQLRSEFAKAGFDNITLQEFGAPTDLLIRLPQDQSPTDPKEQSALIEKLTSVTGENTEKRRVEFVGPQVGDELVTNSAIALGLAILGIMSYVWFRFERPYAIGAVLTLLHDCISVLGLFALTGLEFNLASVAAVLMILGYSVNDTVVIYDYIREYRRKFKKMSWEDLIDISLNQTLSRTVMTGLTTLLALGALAMFGGDVIRGFTVAILAGVIIGTYSSLFVSAPFLLYMKPDDHSKIKTAAE